MAQCGEPVYIVRVKGRNDLHCIGIYFDGQMTKGNAVFCFIVIFFFTLSNYGFVGFFQGDSGFYSELALVLKCKIRIIFNDFSGLHISEVTKVIYNLQIHFSYL